MSELDVALSRLAAHDGVEHLVLVGTDGLLVRHLGPAGPDPETVAAMVPGVAAACRSLARGAGAGGFATAVVEMEQGVAVVAELSSELLLAVLLRGNVGFAALLRELRQERGRLAALL